MKAFIWGRDRATLDVSRGQGMLHSCAFMERNGTLEHPAVPAAGATPPGPPQPSVAAPIDSQRPCGSNPQVATPSARRLRSPPGLTPCWNAGTGWNTRCASECSRMQNLESPESSFAQVSSPIRRGRLRTGTLERSLLQFFKQVKRECRRRHRRHTPS